MAFAVQVFLVHFDGPRGEHVSVQDFEVGDLRENCACVHMILDAIRGCRGEFLNDLVNVAGSDRVDLGVVDAEVVEE